MIDIERLINSNCEINLGEDSSNFDMTLDDKNYVVELTHATDLNYPRIILRVYNKTNYNDSVQLVRYL